MPGGLLEGGQRSAPAGQPACDRDVTAAQENQRTENRGPIVAVKAALTVQRQSPRLSVPTLFGTIAVPHKHL